MLEGSVRRSGNRLRVTAQLTSVADGYSIWSERYDREMADVFAIQDEIVESIVNALAPTLANDAKAVVKRPTENLEAYEICRPGRLLCRFSGLRLVSGREERTAGARRRGTGDGVGSVAR